VPQCLAVLFFFFLPVNKTSDIKHSS
jgi:hypothetical protein